MHLLAREAGKCCKGLLSILSFLGKHVEKLSLRSCADDPVNKQLPISVACTFRFAVRTDAPLSDGRGTAARRLAFAFIQYLQEIFKH